jgi:nitrilase/aliphatic nitrilase
MATHRLPIVRVAAVQAAPVFLDSLATIEKVGSLVAEAARNGAHLVAFGESFVAGFPIWNGVLAPIDQHELHERLVLSAITVPGPEVARLSAIARRHRVMLSIGVNERSAVSYGQVWNANLIFGPDGRLRNHRRKLVGTWYERLTWSHGDGCDLEPVALDGQEGALVGALICGENTNTLARYALLAQGENLHISSYPPSWPFDRREPDYDYNLEDSIRIRSVAHSFEGKLHNVVAATSLGKDAIDATSRGDARISELLTTRPPVSLIVGPRGEVVAGPLVGTEGILYANADLNESISLKQAHDIVGTYNRFDVFRLTVDKRRNNPITVIPNDDRAYTPDPNGDWDSETVGPGADRRANATEDRRVDLHAPINNA